MERREVLLGAGTLLAVAASPVQAADPAGTHHHGTGSPLVATALHCVQAGEVCQAHCFDLIAAGDTSIAACARSVRELTEVCSALAVLAAQHSALLPRYAAVARDACRACEKGCRRHADHHAPCRECAEACAQCAQECAKVAA